MHKTIVIGMCSVFFVAGCTPTVNQGSVAGGANNAVSTQAESTPQAPTWGQRYTWKDGVAIEVATPAKCTPGSYAIPQNIKRAIKVKVTVFNGSEKPFDTALLSIGDAQFNQSNAEKILDSNGSCGGSILESSTVLPNKNYSYEVAYSVGGEPGELQLSFQPDFASDTAIFVGTA